MTLILAKKISGRIQLCADARLIYPEEVVHTPLKGALKLITINDMCIGYAGDYESAIDTIRTLKKRKIFDIGQAVAQLAKAHSNLNGTVDFIVASLYPDIRLFKISNNKVEDNISLAWIGDPSAFNEFQRIYHNLPEPTKLNSPPNFNQNNYETMSEMSKVANTLGVLVRENTVDSVGDFFISVRSTTLGYEYMGNAMGTVVNQSSVRGIRTPLKFSNAQEGGYAYSVLTPVEKNIGVIGVHFYQGELGVLYHPIESHESLIYKKVNVDQFKEKVKKDYGFELDGMSFV